MGLACIILGHKWDGCICTRCRETRDEQHDWNGRRCRLCYQKRSVGAITEQKDLLVVAKDIRESPQDRITAAKKLKDWDNAQVILGDIIKTNSKTARDTRAYGPSPKQAMDLLLRTIDELTNQDVLFDIAKKVLIYEFRVKAIEKMTDQNSLRAISRGEHDRYDIAKFESMQIRIAAAKNLKDWDNAQLILGDIIIAYDKYNKNTRTFDPKLELSMDLILSTIDELTEQNVLYNIVQNAIVYEFKIRAVEKINDQNLLYTIANASDRFNIGCVIRAAVKLENPDACQLIFTRILKGINDTNYNYKDYAMYRDLLSKLTDLDMVSDLAENAEAWGVRRYALRKLPNARETQLQNCAKGYHDWETTALCRITCYVCGRQVYDHDYEIYQSIYEEARWRCKKCNHEGITKDMPLTEDINTLQQGEVR